MDHFRDFHEILVRIISSGWLGTLGGGVGWGWMMASWIEMMQDRRARWIESQILRLGKSDGGPMRSSILIDPSSWPHITPSLPLKSPLEFFTDSIGENRNAKLTNEWVH